MLLLLLASVAFALVLRYAPLWARLTLLCAYTAAVFTWARYYGMKSGYVVGLLLLAAVIANVRKPGRS